jgi:hypothetical protein
MLIQLSGLIIKSLMLMLIKLIVLVFFYFKLLTLTLTARDVNVGSFSTLAYNIKVRGDLTFGYAIVNVRLFQKLC